MIGDILMAKTYNVKHPAGTEAPKTLQDHPFYGFELDYEQAAFRDAIWDPEKLIVFCNARAGTGKTFIATATANLLVQYGRYDGIVYISSPTQEGKLGFLPGEIEDKTAIYSEPFIEALIKLNINPQTAVNHKLGRHECRRDEKYNCRKEIIECRAHTILGFGG